MSDALFVTLVGSLQAVRRARLLVESLRAFGGRLRESPVWVLTLGEMADAQGNSGLGPVRQIPLDVQDRLPRYYFLSKVRACAQAEALAAGQVGTLVWVDPGCLIANPPLGFDLASPALASFRPVHVQNVGSLAGEPLDDYWAAIYRAVGLEDTARTVESFVDGRTLRPYYNTHCFAVDPAAGLMATWLDHFARLVADQTFQSTACRDELHQIFLHQAVLSALLTQALAPEQIRLLPAEYSYPLHFQARIPPSLRVSTLNELACAVYEDDGDLTALPAAEPLASRLRARTG